MLDPIRVTGALLADTTLFLPFARTKWRWATWKVALVAVTIDGHHTSGFDTAQTALLGAPGTGPDELILNLKVGSVRVQSAR